MAAYRRESSSSAMSIALCGLAAFGDTVVLLALWRLAAGVFRAGLWFSPPRGTRYAAVVAGGIVVNAIVEWVAVH